ncbi:hypothetical protein BaRGS_00025020 [Batillaria attramentaria]|uniref:Uncharacterized protein n=1 Tax=Batillaria attramentaria TaxID=370345 RepID=A0ABD0K9A2_9CAEN
MDVFVLFRFGCVLCLAASLYEASTVNAEWFSYHTTARDYIVTSEKYPDLYPADEKFVWNWTTATGMWAVQFVDFKLSCADDPKDTLTITDENKKYLLTCDKEVVNHHYILSSSSFTVELSSHSSRDPAARGFKCKVFHGNNRDELKMKIDTQVSTTQRPDTEEGGTVSSELVIILLVIIVFLIVLALVGGVVWMIFRRRRHQQTTNTSVHLNIGAIRRESAVSYTRHGNGGPPGEGRMGSESSLPPDDTATSPKRPVKRSGSNASWAMRAEMSTSVRNGSCSSDAPNQNSKRAVNVYTPMPGDKPTSSDLDLDLEKSESRVLDESVSSRLSTIPEEPRLSGGKLRSSLLVPKVKDHASLAVGNAGYILMTSCSADYMNFS